MSDGYHRPGGDAAWPLVAVAGLTGAAVVGVNLPGQTLFVSPAEYVPLHTILEFVAIAVSAMVCGLGWNLRQLHHNGSPVVLSSAFFAVAVIDLMHTLSYTGMPQFITPSGPEKAINFWLAGRAMAAIALLAIAVMPDRRWSARACGATLAATVAATALICWLGLLHEDWLPRTFIAGQGLTAVKVGSEYALMAAYGLAALLLWWRARHSGGVGPVWLAAGAWTLGLGESFFTLYADVSDLFNLLGHVYKALAYLMIYRALFVEGVQAPYHALARERAHLRTLLTTIPDLVWLKDPDGLYLTCNPEFELLYGTPEAGIVGRSDYDFVDHDLADFFRAKDREAVSAGRPTVNEEWVTFASDGHRALLETIKTPMRDADGHLIGILGIARDITARKRTETTLKKANEDLEQFAYVASHDLREPLRMVSTHIALLERRYGALLDGPAHELIAFAREGAQRMDRMVLDLLEFSRVGRAADPFQPVCLSDVVAEAIAPLAGIIAATGATIAADHLPEVIAAPGEMAHLFQNLIGNALKYRHPDRPPLIAVTCRAEDDGWTVAVADNGIGIEPDYFERIFAIFQRLHTREKYDGTGIGLAICQKIVHHHGGRIWVESVPGEGSTFFFTLPSRDSALSP